MADGLQQLSNATNVQCYLIHRSQSVPPSLAFFIDPTHRDSSRNVATCTSGSIIGTPITVSLKLLLITPNLKPEELLKRLTEESTNMPLDDHCVVAWAMENNLLRINVNLAPLQALTAGAATTDAVRLPTKPLTIAKSFSATLVVSAPGQADWGFVQTPQRLSEEGDVSRRLHLGSVSPEAEALSPPDSQLAPLTAEQANIEIDTAQAPLVRLTVFPERFHTNTSHWQFTVFNEVGVELTIRVAKRQTTREPRNRKSQPARNVALEESTVRGEPVLIVSFRADQDFGAVDLAALTNVDVGAMFGAAQGGHAPGTAGERRESHLVADAQGLKYGLYTVSLMATRVQLPLPTEKEVYVVVRSFLEPQADKLDSIVMNDVRDYVFTAFKGLNRIPLSQRQELNQLTWSCTRLFVLNTLVEQKEDPSDDVDDIVFSVINRQGGAGYLYDDSRDEL